MVLDATASAGDWRSCLGSGCGRTLLARRIHGLDAQFKLQNPLLIVIWTKLASMVGNLGRTVAFKLPCKVCNLRLKLLIRLHHASNFIIAASVA